MPLGGEERARDMLETRRKRIGKDRRAEFDAFHGTGSRRKGSTGAGKGDTYRDVDKERYDVGYELAFETDPDRIEHLTRRWKRLGALQRGRAR